MAFSEEIRAHLQSGATTLCHAWAIIRADGESFGFTDHDLDLAFDGLTFRAGAGLGAKAISRGSGLAVDNTAALGALSDAGLREDEIEQGRFDAAEVRAWRVNWADPSQRWLHFRGTIGEMRRAGGAFHAELRGLTEALNRPMGRIYQKPCTAVLGDGACRFALDAPGYATEQAVETEHRAQSFRWSALPGFEAGWFTRGRLEVLEGPAAGLWGVIKQDAIAEGERVIDLWEPIRGAIPSGTRIRLNAGCDKRMETCRKKFDNLLNFQGFPDLPNEDWSLAVPRSGQSHTGGSRR